MVVGGVIVQVSGCEVVSANVCEVVKVCEVVSGCVVVSVGMCEVLHAEECV